MSSFYAELTVDGQTYPVRECQLGVSQATAGRGQVSTQVRPRLVQLILDVPSTDALLMWAATPFRPQAGHITFFQADRLTARETVGFTAGQCVRYRETFVVGDSRTGAYVCQLTIAAEHLTITPGGPAGEYVPAAAREYAAPVAAASATVEVVARQVAQSSSSNLPGNPMNPERMELWQRYLEKRGVKFYIGTPEAELKLHDYEADGMFSAWGNSIKTIFLHDPPGTATFFEEAFHALQSIHNHPAIKTLETGQEVDAWEYDAKQALLKHSGKLGLSYEEYIETEKQLQQVIDNEYGDYGT